MKLYKLSQGDQLGYDTYDSCIVAARNEEEARQIHPNSHMSEMLPKPKPMSYWWENNYTWAYKPENVTVELIGTAIKGTKAGLILGSFNAG